MGLSGYFAKRICQAWRWIDALESKAPEPGESTVWDIGEATFLYLLVSICLAGVLL